MIIDIRPQINLPKFLVTKYGLPNTKPHPKKAHLCILPRIDLSSPEAATANATPKLAAWLSERLTPEQMAESGVKLFGNTDGDALTNWEEFATGQNPVMNWDGDPCIISWKSSNGAFRMQHCKNLNETGIEHIIEVGDGVNFVPAVEGVDYVAVDITGGGMFEAINNYGTDQYKTRILENKHLPTEPAKAFIRLRLTQTIE